MDPVVFNTRITHYNTKFFNVQNHDVVSQNLQLCNSESISNAAWPVYVDMNR